MTQHSSLRGSWTPRVLRKIVKFIFGRSHSEADSTIRQWIKSQSVMGMRFDRIPNVCLFHETMMPYFERNKAPHFIIAPELPHGKLVPSLLKQSSFNHPRKIQLHPHLIVPDFSPLPKQHWPPWPEHLVTYFTSSGLTCLFLFSQAENYQY